MNKTYDAVCLGFVVQDIIITGIPSDALMHNGTTMGTSAMITSGGDAGNEAITLGRLGSKTAPLIRLGCDSIGNSIFSILKNEPLDTSLVIQRDDAETMMAIVVIKPDGERSFLVKRSNDESFLKHSDVTDEILKDTRAVTVGSMFCLPGLDGEPMADILKRAQSFGALTFCDMTHDMDEIGPETVSCVYPHVDYMMPSYEEAVYVTGEEDPDKIADYFLAHGVKHVVLKLGGDGCFFKDAERRFFTDPFDIKPVDTTGCGDNFVGGFTHAVLKGWEPEFCTEFASAVGAINATKTGAHHALENEAQVLEFIKNTPRRILNR